MSTNLPKYGEELDNAIIKVKKKLISGKLKEGGCGNKS